MPKVRWVVLYRFCSKFHTLSSSAKNFENRLRFDKVTESLKVETFLRHSVVYAVNDRWPCHLEVVITGHGGHIQHLARKFWPLLGQLYGANKLFLCTRFLGHPVDYRSSFSHLSHYHVMNIHRITCHSHAVICSLIIAVDFLSFLPERDYVTFGSLL